MFYRIFVLCSLFLLGLTNTYAEDAPPSAYDLFKPPTHSQFALSPSGRYFSLAYATTAKRCIDSTGAVDISAEGCSANETRHRTSYQIVIFDLEIKSAISIRPLPEDYFVQWFQWATDDRLLAGISRRATINTRRSRWRNGGTRIMSFPREQGEYITLFENALGIKKSNLNITQIGNMLRDDPDHVIVSAVKKGDLDLWKANIRTGDVERIAIGNHGTFFWYTDNNGKPVLRYDANLHSTKVSVFAWSDESQNWEKVKTFKLKENDDEDDFQFFPAALTNNPHQVYVISDEDDDARRSIKIYDLQKQEYVETVFEHEKYDVAGVSRDIATGEYTGAWYYADRLQYHFADKKTQAHYDAINLFFDDEANVSLLGFTQTGTKAVIYVNAPDIPGEYYVYDFTTSNIDPVIQQHPELASVKFGKGEVLTLPTRDGETITAYLTHPAGGEDHDAPLIVMPHGGPESRDYLGYNPRVQFFATRGYQTLQVNFRGSSGYGRAFSEAGYGEWGGVMQNDVTDAVRYVHANGSATPDKTCIVGYSYGGYVALHGAVSTPNLYKCVVSVAGVSDLVLAMKLSRRYYGHDSEFHEYWVKSIGNPNTEKEKLRSRSPANFADKITSPVLLIHGELDGIVRVEQSRKMNRALKQAGADVEYIEVKYEGHRGWSMENHILQLTAVENFLEKHLQP